jgi:hypothetical protein
MRGSPAAEHADVDAWLSELLVNFDQLTRGRQYRIMDDFVQVCVKCRLSHHPWQRPIKLWPVPLLALMREGEMDVP